MEKKEDRISALPDDIIQHILSFLPSTKKAIQTGVLSKRWQNQWSQVPVLIFNSYGMSDENFLEFIDNTLILYRCSKLKKFHLQYYYCNRDPKFFNKISFAARKDVEEFYFISNTEEYVLPEFLFNNALLVKLRTRRCTFFPDGKVNWESLTTLIMENCKLTDQAIKHILSGSPLLKSLELSNCAKFDKLSIASKSLKRLVLVHDQLRYNAYVSVIEILCPSLEELCLNNVTTYDRKSFAHAIENVLSNSSLLESIELIKINSYGVHNQLAIASNSLKRLVLRDIYNFFNIQISCPHLEELKLLGYLNVTITTTLLNLSPSLCATIDTSYHGEINEIDKNWVKNILHQLQHVNELTIGSSFIKALSALEVGDLLSPLLNMKCLTLNSPNLNNKYSRIACVLGNSPVLEKLVINLPSYDQKYGGYGNPQELIDSVENFWNSNAASFNCLLSHLKTIKIVDFPNKYGNRKVVLKFVQFLLNNAKLLEKMVVVLKGDRTSNITQVSEEWLSLPRCSQNAIIELIFSNQIGKFL